MANIVESLDAISKTMENILDFAANDDELSNDFQEYLSINHIEVESEKDFNNVIIQYMLDMKMQNGLRVLEYYRRKQKNNPELIDALLNSFCCVFKINKIMSNAYLAQCITSEASVTLVPMVKMHHLKQIGRNDYIQARIIDLAGTLYILEIYDVISEYNEAKASSLAIRYLLQNPKSSYFKNDAKKEKLIESAKNMYDNFKNCFKNDFVITTNKKIDGLIEFFNDYMKNKKDKPYDEFIEKVEKNRFFKIDEFNCDDETFMEQAVFSFEKHKETYDIAMFCDKKRGLYIIPFFETFLKCFEEEIEGASDCIKEFLTSDKIPPSVIKYAYEKYDNFFEVINYCAKIKFSSLEEVLFNTKAAFIDNGIFSPVVILFNSDLFANLLKVSV